MANEVKKLNTIAITDIKNVNGQTDENIKELNAQEFQGYAGTAGAWHGARFVGMGVATYSPYTGFTRYNNIQYKAATSTGNASNFGDAQEAYAMAAGFSNGTRMVAMDGEKASSAYDTTIDYITTASTGDASDFGDTNLSKRIAAGCTNGTIGVSVGGRTDSAETGASIEYVTIASTGNSANWGDISSAQYGANQTEAGAISGHTRGVIWSAKQALGNIIEYITWASQGDTVDFGDLTQNAAYVGDAGCEDTIRGIMYPIGGEWSPAGEGSESIEYITMASTGNSTDFGDAAFYVSLTGSFSNGTRAESWGGRWYGPDNDAYTTASHIEYITIASLGNGTDQGDLDQNALGFACASGSA